MKVPRAPCFASARTKLRDPFDPMARDSEFSAQPRWNSIQASEQSPTYLRDLASIVITILLLDFDSGQLGSTQCGALHDYVNFGSSCLGNTRARGTDSWPHLLSPPSAAVCGSSCGPTEHNRNSKPPSSLEGTGDFAGDAMSHEKKKRCSVLEAPRPEDPRTLNFCRLAPILPKKQP